MKISSILNSSVVALAALAAGCGGPEFHVEGTVDGASDRSVVLEKADYAGIWQAIDSTRTDSKGKFKLSYASPASPEIYRLGIDGQWVYFPVDSTETITVTAPLDRFATDFTLAGSDQAAQMEKFEKEVIAFGTDLSPQRLEAFRRGVYTNYLQNSRGSIVSYYVLTKTVGGHPLFDPADPDAVKYFGAVASSFKQYRPDDPHAAMLEATARDGLKRRNTAAGKQKVYEATGVDLIDITLPDEEGRDVSLSSVSRQGKPTLLVFSLMNHPDSPELNRLIREMQTRHGINVYHVCVDADQYDWREGARNLPWATVYDATGENSRALASYNVGVLPTFFIIDRQGRLSERVDHSTELDSKLAKY